MLSQNVSFYCWYIDMGSYTSRLGFPSLPPFVVLFIVSLWLGEKGKNGKWRIKNGNLFILLLYNMGISITINLLKSHFLSFHFSILVMKYTLEKLETFVILPFFFLSFLYFLSFHFSILPTKRKQNSLLILYKGSLIFFCN